MTRFPLPRKTELVFIACLIITFNRMNSFLPRLGPKLQKPSLNREINSNRHRQNQEIDKAYEVTWNINLGGKEFLIESPFLKAGLEQSIKDYINQQIKCESDFNPDLSSFYSVEILVDPDTKNLKSNSISGKGKCKGNRTRCKRKVKTSISDAGKNTNLFNLSLRKNDFCSEFRSKTIFDSFSQILITATHFNYNVDVDVTNNLGDLQLNYNVTYVEAKGGGLDQIEDVDLDADDPREYISNCAESQCITQNLVMRNIFSYFEVPFDESTHECLFPGVNCNKDDMVTHIWMSKYTKCHL